MGDAFDGLHKVNERGRSGRPAERRVLHVGGLQPQRDIGAHVAPREEARALVVSLPAADVLRAQAKPHADERGEDADLAEGRQRALGSNAISTSVTIEGHAPKSPHIAKIFMSPRRMQGDMRSEMRG